MTISDKNGDNKDNELDIYSVISENEEIITEEYHPESQPQEQKPRYSRGLTSPFDEAEKKEGIVSFGQVINGVPIAKDVFEIDETGFHAKSNKKNGFFKGIILAIVGIALIALVGAGYAAYVILATVLSAIIGIVRGLWFTSLNIIILTFSRLLSVFGIVIVIIVGMHFFWKFNPDLRAQFDYKKSQLEGIISEYVGVSLPKMPEFQDILDYFKGKADDVGVSLPEFGSLEDAFKSWGVSAKDIEQYVPKGLAPILGVVQNSEDLGKYVELFTAGSLGDKVDGAIPLLENSLMGNNKELSGAAMQSLEMINTPSARKIVAKYKRMLNNSLKDFDLNNSLKDLNVNDSVKELQIGRAHV